ncbi:AsmA family protein [Granulicella sp. 5B5]|uniref:AsmA family protein n=1 Tax=Granulicella sp. 5B5 TaxID=1617967 RepID=UPI0015F433F7|nr:AsmA family protein [Granulicella sp. 5B5]QMV19083.1 AsmA family protein [Granulicella sp. 5B5]
MMEIHEHRSETTADTPPSRVRARLLWSAGIVGLVLLLLLTPPLINVSRLRKRIATSLSESLGRPVHLDGVTLQLLPIPGFTLQNLVVSEDPAFGNEPVIRANTVEITLRPSSLWRRQVELSSIRFVEPSLNLVRNADGQWNLQGLLKHAAQVNTAPTGQSKAGPAPRFPYIEATNGRVNVKLAEEKQPFSLTDADFALWLPSEEQWRVRLEGQPARTDMNVSDAGTMRLEGSLERATTVGAVPVDLVASWHDAPLGEASKLLTGVDAGWRGTLNMDATLSGPMSDAKFVAKVHLNDLRRSDFVPVRLLDVSVECGGQLDAPEAVVHDPSCALATPVPEGGKNPGQVVAIADQLELSGLHAADRGLGGLRLGMTNVADSYVLDWARLFSQRIPVQDEPRGVVAGSVTYSPDATEGWLGEFHARVAGPLPWAAKPVPAGATEPMTISVSANQRMLTLAPLSLAPTVKAAPLELAGHATLRGYTLRLAGSATVQELQSMRGTLPPLADGLEAALPGLKTAGDRPLKVDVTCSRVWGGVQSCAAVGEAPTPAKKRKRLR